MTKALSLQKVFDSIAYEPHSGQKRVHAAKATSRFRVVCAGRRLGKSLMGGHELYAHCLETYTRRHLLDGINNRDEYWIVGPEYSDSEKEFRVLWGDLQKRGVDLDHPGSYYDPVGGSLHISCFGGRFQVHGKSAKYPDQLVGEGLRGVIMAEAAKLKQSIWPKYIRPMLIDHRGWALMTSTPEGKNWFYDQYMMPMKGAQDYWSIRMPSWVNDKLFPLGRDDPEIQSILGPDESTQETFNQEIGAEFTEFVGKVFKNFDEELHCRHIPYNTSPSYKTFACVDYGFTNPFVWLLLQVDVWDNVYVIGEYYQSGMRIDEIPAELRSRNLVPPKLRVFYPDPASPGDSRVLSDELKLHVGPNTGGELKDRIRLIRNWLEVPKGLQHLPWSHPERLPKLFIDPVKCPNLVREMNDYRYPENKREHVQNDSENPQKKDDHAPEALGRFMAGYFGPKIKSGRARIVKPAMSR